MAQNPVVNFTADKTSGCAPLTVTFTDQSSGNPISWNWEFSNGRLTTGPTTSVTFSSPGTYSVKLVVRNATGIGSTEKINYITVFPSPTVSFIADKTTACIPADIKFTSIATTPVGTITKWEWDFGDNFTSDQPNPSHTYTTPGFYTVSLKVISSTTCEATALAVRYIRVVGGIETDFTFTAPGTCTAPFTVNFQNQANGPGNLTYTWNFDNGAPPSNLENPSATYNSTGTYTVRLDVVSSLGCIGFKEKTVTISGTATDFIAPAVICPGSSVKFQNNSSPAPVSSTWTFDDGTGSGQISPTKIFVTPGIYNIKVINQYAGCKDSITKPVTVSSKPTVDFKADDSTSCKVPFTVNFTDLTSGGLTWKWDFGDNSPPFTVPNPSHEYKNFGEYTVSLIVTTGSGCIDTFIKKDFIKIRETVVTINGTPAGGCIPYIYKPTANIKTLDPVTGYAWDMGEPGATYTGPTPTHTYTKAGNYDIKLTVTTESGCIEPVTVPNGVRTGIPPVVNFTYSPLNSCASTPITFNSSTTTTTPGPGAVVEWLWKFDDGTTSKDQNPTHTFKDTGALIVTLIVSNNGCQDSAKQTLQVLPPVANFGYKAICANAFQIQFEDSSLTNPIYGPITYQWQMGDLLNTTIPGPTPPVFTYPGVGTYNATLTVTNGPCTYTITKPVIVIQEPADFAISKNPVCKDEFFILSAITSNPANIKSYTWTIGSNPPFTDAPRNISTGLSANGLYDVTLAIIDTNGCPITKTIPNYITVRSPLANFAVTNDGGCYNKPVIFNDLSTPAGLITEWKWNFGDALPDQIFTAPPFSHTYSLTGGFSVSLTVKDNNGCTDIFTSPANIIIANPKAGFRAPNIYCPLTPLLFTDTSQGGIGLTYEWNFGDNSPMLTGPNPQHQYPAGDREYNVKLKISDAYGCEDSVTKTNYISIRSPKPAFDILDTVSICPPLQTKFTFRGADYKSFYWDFGDNSGILDDFKNPSNYYNSVGTFIPKLYLVGPGGCIDSAQAKVTVYDPAATTQINYGPTLSGCNSLLLNYNLTTTPGFRFKFFYGDGSVDSSQQKILNHLYPSPGNYSPYITIYDPSGCEAALSGGKVVNVFGAIPLFGKDKKEFCDNGEVFFTDFTLTNDPIVSRNWDFGDSSPASTDLNTSHRYNAPGTYITRLTVVTEYPCESYYQDTVRVYRTPSPVINARDTICINTTEFFRGSLQQNDSITYWKWDFGNRSTSDEQNPSTLFNATGDFTVKLEAQTKIGCPATTEKKIHVVPLPTVMAVTDPIQIALTGGTNLNMNYTGPVVSYKWTPQFKLDCSDCPTPFATPNVTTKYKVQVQDKYGCLNTGEVTVVVVCNGENFFIPNTFSPNGDGSNDVFYVRGKGLFRVRSLRIFNRLGEVVFEKREFAPNNPALGWDGKYKGNKPKADVYVYQVELYCDGGQIVQFAGNVALIQ
jgi:gliding motility-associated-like protein